MNRLTVDRSPGAPKAEAAACAVDEPSVEAINAAVEPTRLRIMFLLGQCGRLCVGDIASRFRITRPAISHHLRILRTCGLVRTEKEGQEVFYTLCKDRLVGTLRKLADALDTCCQKGSRK